MKGRRALKVGLNTFRSDRVLWVVHMDKTRMMRLETRNVKASHSEYRSVKIACFYFLSAIVSENRLYLQQLFLWVCVKEHQSSIKISLLFKALFPFHFNMKVVVL